ncbi:Putrescine transporter PotE [Streptomyces griseomycini]
MLDQGAPPHNSRPTAPSASGVGARLMRRKPVEHLVAEGGQGEGGSLRRSLGLWQLTMISIGATLGTGIFVVLGEAVPKAGPAVTLSFVIAGLTALFSALSYAELAGTIPVSGSSYSYAYATMGELVAWVCGWCLVLEYGVSVAAVAVGWGEYLNELLDGTIGVTIPAALSAPPGDGGVFNLPALIVVLLAMAFLLGGARESARANTVMVIVKIGALVLFCAIGVQGFRSGNYENFMPLGMAGVSAAGATLFFSYIGFDAASTAGEEARNAQRDLPRAILLSLVIITVLYVLVAAVAVGAKPWKNFTDSEAALAQIMREVTGQTFWGTLLAFCAVIAIASVVLTVLYGQTRVLFAMARDGLVPKAFARVHPKTGTPAQHPDRLPVLRRPRLRRLPGGDRAGRRPAPAAHRGHRAGHPHLGRGTGHGAGDRRGLRRLRGDRLGERAQHRLRGVRGGLSGDGGAAARGGQSAGCQGTTVKSPVPRFTRSNGAEPTHFGSPSVSAGLPVAAQL